MKKIFTRLMLFAALCAGTAELQAQCIGSSGRYLNQVFSSFDTSTVRYSTVYNLDMDVYEPTGDTATKRPLIILAHGGSFVSGNKNADATVTDLCARFAKRGYVTASINYRLAGGLFDLLDSLNAIDVVMKAIGDAKAAIRYFRADAAGANRFRIDPDFIYVGGNSAGAVLGVHLCYITSEAEVPSYVAQKIASNGGIEGNSGNTGFCSNANGVINLAGAINQSAWISAGDPPCVSAHGDQDKTVPFICDDALQSSTGGIVDVVDLCGSGAMQPVLNAAGIRNVMKVFPGDDHVPWMTSAAKFNFIDSMAAQFVFEQYCDQQFSYKNCFGVSSRELETDHGFELMPNPAKGFLKLNTSSSAGFDMIRIFKTDGSLVREWNAAGAYQPQIQTESLGSGIFILQASYKGGKTAPSTKRFIQQ